MKHLLYFFPNTSSFVEADREILRKKYNVFSFAFKPRFKWHTPYFFISQFFFIVFRLRSTDVLFSQFSGYHSFLPALAGRMFNYPHYIILHGTECNNFPEYNYGFLIRPLLYWFSKKSLAWSTKLFPVSDALVNADYTYNDTKYTKQGFKHFYPGIITPYEVINNGVSIDQFNITASGPRNPLTFITVASGLNSPNRRAIKGIDMVIKLAMLTPEYSYTIIGASGALDLDLPRNITVMDYIPNQELPGYYNRNAFYLQLSVSEGFVISVCEAMLCGCIPIVSNVGALPVIAGETGYVLERKDIDLLVPLVRKAVSEYTPDAAVHVRQHIANNFTIAERERRLLAALENL